MTQTSNVIPLNENTTFCSMTARRIQFNRKLDRMRHDSRVWFYGYTAGMLVGAALMTALLSADD